MLDFILTLLLYVSDDDFTGTEESSTEAVPTKGKAEEIKDKVLDVAHTVGEEVGAPDWVIVSIFVGESLAFWTLTFL